MRLLAFASALFIAVVGVYAIPVIERRTTQSVVDILTELRHSITPLTNQLQYATHNNATQGTLAPVVSNIGGAVNNAAEKLQQLQGQSSNVILASTNGTTVGADEIASLIAEIFTLIFTALGAVLKVVDQGIESLIHDLLTDLGKTVLGLLAIVLSLVTGLINPLSTLLGPILAVIANLGLTALLSALLGGLL